MKIINLRARIRNLVLRHGKRSSSSLAAAIVTGGMVFSGTAHAANVIVNGGFEIAAGDPGSGWTNQGGNYTHPYGGINGPQLTEVGTLNNYGFNDNISADAGSSFHGLSFPTTQTVQLVNPDLTAGDILAGEGRFEFSSWLAACCNDVPKVTATFNDTAGTSVSLNRGIADFQVTTADILVNPGGPDNATSQGVTLDASRRYWALYEFRGVIPTDATEVTIAVDDGRADAAAAGATVGGNGNDNYADMMIFDAVQSTEPLSLELQVDKLTGDLTIVNNTVSPFSVNFYEIISSGNSGTLNNNWDSFADQGLDSLGGAPEQNWTEGGGSGPNLLTEAFLLGSTTFANGGGSETLADGYSGGVGGAEDLVFRYGLENGQLLSGVVSYESPMPDPPDYDGDGNVDGDDFLFLQREFTNAGDFADWEAQYGSGTPASGAAAAVPEPASILLVGMGLGLMVGVRRRER